MKDYFESICVEQTKNRIVLKCPAKINLFLKVVSKREDGFHNLETVMQTIDLCDELSIERVGEGIEFDCDSDEVPAGEGNISYKAAKLFLEKSGLRGGMKIKLVKNIPVAAGLGGGSSDAAGVFLGLNRLFGNPFLQSDLVDMASELGSDVPFFLYGGTALCRGKGEIVEPLPDAPLFWVVLVNPGIKVSTASIYNKLNLSLTRPQSAGKMLTSVKNCHFDEILASLYNQLEEEVLKEVTSLQNLKSEMEEVSKVKFMVSGSGSTLFAICKSEASGKDVFDRLTAKFRSRLCLALTTNQINPT